MLLCQNAQTFNLEGSLVRRRPFQPFHLHGWAPNYNTMPLAPF